MAIYNGETYLHDAVCSVLAQRFDDWELIAVDDGSSDSSLEIIRGYSDERIVTRVNDENLGLVGVRNRILQEARGKYLAWLDQDDLAYPERLGKQVTFLDAQPEIAACGSWSDLITHETSGDVHRDRLRLPTQHNDIRAQLLFRNPLSCNTVMMRVDAFRQSRLQFRAPFGNSLDYDMWSLSSDTLRLANIPQALGAYRVHGNQTSQGRALEVMHDHEVRVQAELIERALHFDMTEPLRALHRKATVWPVVFRSINEALALAEWFGRLRTTNEAYLAFDRDALDRAIARQWITVCRGAQRGGIPARRVGPLFVQGMRTIGLRPGPMRHAFIDGLRSST